jgi:hypothetical protein
VLFSLLVKVFSQNEIIKMICVVSFQTIGKNGPQELKLWVTIISRKAKKTF